MRKRYIIIGGVLALLAIPMAAVLWLFYSQPGLHFVVSQLHRLQTVTIKLDEVSGTLAGPLRVGRLEVDHKRVRLVAHDIAADFRLHGLLTLTASVRSLTGRDVLVEVRRVQEEDPEKPPRFLPAFLHIVARDVSIDGVRFVNFNGFEMTANRAHANVVRIDSSDLSVEGFEVLADPFDARGNYSMQATRPLQLKANAVGTLRLPNRVPTQLGATLDGHLDELMATAQLRSPDVATVRATFTRPNDSWRVQGTVFADALGLHGLLTNPPLQLTNVSLQFDAQPATIRAQGRLTVPEVAPLDIDATGRFADRVLTLDESVIRVVDTNTVVSATGAVKFGDSPAVDMRAQWQHLQWPVTGTAKFRSNSGAIVVTGAMPYALDIQGALGGGGIPDAQLEAKGSIDKDHLQLGRFAVQTLEGSLQGKGQVQFKKPQRWTLSAKSNRLDPSALHADFPGRVNVDLEATGTGLDRNARFSAHVRQLGGQLRGETLGGSGRVARENGVWQLDRVDVRWGAAALVANGYVGDRLEVEWSARAAALEKLVPDVRGSFVSVGSARGPLKTPHVIATLEADQVSYRGWRAGSINIDADVDVNEKSDVPSKLKITAQDVGRDDPMLARVSLDASGTARRHELVLDMHGVPPQDLPGSMAHLALNGSFIDRIWSATLNEGHANAAGRELRMEQPAQIQATQNFAKLERVCFAISTGDVCGSAEWRTRGPWRAALDVSELPIALFLTSKKDNEQYSGTIKGFVRAGGDPGARWVGETDLTIDDAAISYRLADGTSQVANLGSGVIAGAASADAFTATVDLRALENTFLRGNARLQRFDAPIMQLPLSGELALRTADATIVPVVVPDIDRASGVLEATLNAAGTLAEPQIEGRVALANAELDSYRLNLALRELSLNAQLNETQVQFDSTARVGDGVLRSDGRFAWSGRSLRGAFTMKGTDLLVADLPEYRVVASPDLRFNIDGSDIAVTGDVRIPSALIQPVDLTGAVRVSEDARLIGEHAAEKARRVNVSSEIRVIIGEDVRVESFGLQAQLQGDVSTVVKTGEVPIGRGELSVKEGRYKAYGQDLEITRGRMMFDATPLDNPSLDIQAERKREDITVGLNVRGTLRSPRLSFFSDSEPAMSQLEIVQYLLVGKPPDDFQNRDAQSTGSARDTLALQGGGFLASQIGKRIGLEEVGVQSDAENGAALVLGKFLSPRLFVSYGISLAESINTLKMRYTISDRWVLKTESGEDHAADLEFTIEHG